MVCRPIHLGPRGVGFGLADTQGKQAPLQWDFLRFCSPANGNSTHRFRDATSLGDQNCHDLQVEFFLVKALAFGMLRMRGTLS